MKIILKRPDARSTHVFTEADLSTIQVFEGFVLTQVPRLVGLCATQAMDSITGEEIRLRAFSFYMREVGHMDTILNPEILGATGTPRLFAEQCASEPNYTFFPPRWPAIEVRYTRPDLRVEDDGFPEPRFKYIEERLHGDVAQLWQHQIELLDGVRPLVVCANQFFEEPEHMEPKPNTPCPCDSGAKFKRCCDRPWWPVPGITPPARAR